MAFILLLLIYLMMREICLPCQTFDHGMRNFLKFFEFQKTKEKMYIVSDNYSSVRIAKTLELDWECDVIVVLNLTVAQPPFFEPPFFEKKPFHR